jgi:hypothetical protein
MTVVPDCGGTTTVVFFCGGGGLLLLMHPLRPPISTSDANMIFMFNPRMNHDGCTETA